MFPAGSPVTVPTNEDFVFYYRGRRDPKVDYCMAGKGINDPSLGLMYQLWRVRIDNDKILLGSEKTGNGYQDEFVVMKNPDADNVTLAFDNNMQPAICMKHAREDVVTLYYYDTIANAYVTKEIKEVTNPFIRIDDNRPSAYSRNDIILSYENHSDIIFRMQRDRYDLEYYFVEIHEWQKVYQCGMNVKLRFQYQLVWDHEKITRCQEKWNV